MGVDPFADCSWQCDCGSRDWYFDRTVCPEPCGSMHDRCSGCGRADECPWEPTGSGETDDAGSVIHVNFGTGETRVTDPETDWAHERQDVLVRFMVELSKATGDGSKKRQSGEKPAWYVDSSHEGAVFSHITKWKRGEIVDPDSGAHPLVHAAWRLLAIACSESGNHP